MTEILPNLYLSMWHELPSLVERLDDPFVLNCTTTLPLVSENTSRLPVDDDGKLENVREMTAMIRPAIEEIRWRLKKGVVIVHCLAGRQRSATVIAGYLMVHLGFTKERAIEIIRMQKPDAFVPKINFEESLDSLV